MDEHITGRKEKEAKQNTAKKINKKKKEPNSRHVINLFIANKRGFSQLLRSFG